MLAKASEAPIYDDENEKDAFARAVREAHVPRAIVGDLDSVRPEVLAFYQSRGCETVDLSHDQDTTDLHKAVTWLERDRADGAAENETVAVASWSPARSAAGSTTRCRTYRAYTRFLS
jgi:hypothetical protein